MRMAVVAALLHAAACGASSSSSPPKPAPAPLEVEPSYAIAVVRDAAPTLELDVELKRWVWSVRPTASIEELDLVLPVGVAVRLLFRSIDGAYRLRLGVPGPLVEVPAGGQASVVVRAERVVTLTARCLLPCGEPAPAHGALDPQRTFTPTIHVVTADAYAAHLEELSAIATARQAGTPANGAWLFTRLGCVACHKVHEPSIGPPVAQRLGQRVDFTDGTSLDLTAASYDAYVRAATLAPAAQVVVGYGPVMPPFEGQLTPGELDALVAFMRCLQGDACAADAACAALDVCAAP